MLAKLVMRRTASSVCSILAVIGGHSSSPWVLSSSSLLELPGRDAVMSSMIFSTVLSPQITISLSVVTKSWADSSVPSCSQFSMSELSSSSSRDANTVGFRNAYLWKQFAIVLWVTRSHNTAIKYRAYKRLTYLEVFVLPIDLCGEMLTSGPLKWCFIFWIMSTYGSYCSWGRREILEILSSKPFCLQGKPLIDGKLQLLWAVGITIKEDSDFLLTFLASLASPGLKTRLLSSWT